jgi:geranylgeranyl reductase family protein
MDSYDVLIVGGGPAGSSCAWALRHSELKVGILDKQVFPRDKICGGWITPEVLTELEIDAAEYRQRCVLQPIEGFLVGSVGCPPLETSYPETVSYGVRRREFDDYLLRRSGAKLLLGATLTSVTRTPEGWIVNNAIQARFLVGAGGHFCPVARLLGAKESNESPVVAQEVEFQMDARQRDGCRVRGEIPELYFCPDMKGYGWCFRKGDFLNVGLGRADSHRLPAHVKGFLEFLKSVGRISFDVPPLHGHAYLLNGSSTRSLAGDGFLLVGDAAGLAYLQSGEGILPAIESGLLAAESILRRAPDSYRARLAHPQESTLMRIGRFLPSWMVGSLARTLLKTHWFVRNIVLNEWFLHRNSEETPHASNLKRYLTLFLRLLD